MWLGEDTETSFNKAKTVICDQHLKQIGDKPPDEQKYAHLLKEKMTIFWIMKVRIMEPLLFQTPYVEPYDQWLSEVVNLKEPGILDLFEDKSLKSEIKEIVLLFDSVSTSVLSKLMKFCCECSGVYDEHKMFYVLSADYVENGISIKDLSLTEVIQHFSSKDVYKDVWKVFRNCDQKIISAAIVISYCFFIDISHSHELEKNQFEKEINVMQDEMPESDLRVMAKHIYERGRYGEAIDVYTCALKERAFNFYYYGNRAQALIKVGQYELAAMDCRAAILLNPHWAKAYYRLATAFEGQKFIELARNVLIFGISYCDDADKQTLVEFYNKLTAQYKQMRLKSKEPCKNVDSNDHSKDPPEDMPELASSDSSCEDIPDLVDSSNSEAEDSKQKDVVMKPSNISKRVSQKDNVEIVPKLVNKSKKQRKNSISAHTVSSTRTEKSDAINEVKSTQNKDNAMKSNVEHELKQFMESLKKGSLAIENKSESEAIQHFQQALLHTKTSRQFIQKYNFGELSLVCLKYAYGIASSRCNSMENLQKSIDTFKEIIEHHQNIQFPGTYFGLGYCYYRLNDFKTALTYLQKVPSVISKDQRCGIYTWPGTEKIIEELRSDNLMSATEDLIKKCECPLPADAVCRYGSCPYIRIIYFTDLEFKGFASISCGENCKLQYHSACWKTLKDSENKTDKEFLDTPCLTPDCSGFIVRVEIINKEKVMEKCFESDGVKQKKNLKQKKSKLEKKLDNKERKRQRHRSRSISESKDILPEENENHIEPLTAAAENKVHSKMVVTDEGKVKSEVAQNVCEDSKQKENSIVTEPHSQEKPVYIIKKDVDDKQNSDSKISKHKEKKKTKKVLTLGQFCESYQASDNIVSFDENALRMHRLRESKRVTEEAYYGQDSLIGLNAVEAVSDSFYSDINSRTTQCRLNDLLNPYETSIESKDLSKQKAEIYTQIEDLLSKKGALSLKDPFLIKKIKSLPVESKKIIEECGGFEKFIQQDIRFAIVGETLCLFSEMCDVYNSRQKLDELDSFEEKDNGTSRDLSDLNPNAAEYSPPEHIGDISRRESYTDDLNLNCSSNSLCAITKLRQPLSALSVLDDNLDHSSMESFQSDDFLESDNKSVDDKKIVESLQMLLSCTLPEDVIECLHAALKKVQRNANQAQKIMHSVDFTSLSHVLDKSCQVGCSEAKMKSKCIMTEENIMETEEVVSLLHKQVSEMKEKQQMLEENLENALDNNRKLQNKLNVDIPDLSKRLEETEEEKEKEKNLLKNKIVQLEKDVKQWRQKHDQVVDSHKDTEKDITRLQAKFNSASTRIKSLEDDTYEKEQKIEKLSDMLSKQEKLIREKEKLLNDANNRAKKAEMDLLNVKKTEFLERLDISIKTAKQKLSEVQDGFLQSKDNLPGIIASGIEDFIKKLNDHLKSLYEMRIVTVRKIEDQILQLEVGHHLSDLKALDLPLIPDLPNMDELTLKSPRLPGSYATGLMQQPRNIVPQFPNTSHYNYQVPNMNPPLGQRFPLNPNGYPSSQNQFHNASMQGGYAAYNSTRTNYFNQNFANPTSNSNPLLGPPVGPSSLFSSQSSLARSSFPASAVFPPGLPNNGLYPTISSPKRPNTAPSKDCSDILPDISKAGDDKEHIDVSVKPFSEEKSSTRSTSPSYTAGEGGGDDNSEKLSPFGANKTIPSANTYLQSDEISERDFHSSVTKPARKCSSQESESYQQQSASNFAMDKPRSSSPAMSVGASSIASLGTTSKSGKPKKSYSKLLDKLKDKFPEIPEDDLKGYMMEYRNQKTKFSGMSMDVIVAGVTELINKSIIAKIVCKPKQPLPKVLTNKPLCSTKPAHIIGSETKANECPWGKPLSSGLPASWEDENAGDTCVICLHQMTPETTKKIQCGHSYHIECIREWLSRNSTCSICRSYIVLDEDFPALK